MTSPNELVTEFHTVYGHPIRDTNHPTVDYERVHMRYMLIAEEFAELTCALYGPQAESEVSEAILSSINRHKSAERNVVAAADALADLVYVIYGMALESGIPLDRVLEEVQRSNMSKLGADGAPILRDDGKILKGPNFTEPDIPSILFSEAETA